MRRIHRETEKNNNNSYFFFFFVKVARFCDDDVDVRLLSLHDSLSLSLSLSKERYKKKERKTPPHNKEGHVLLEGRVFERERERGHFFFRQKLPSKYETLY